MMLSAICGWAQTKDSIDVSIFTVGYNFTVNTTDREGNAVVDSLHTILMVGANVTKTNYIITNLSNYNKSVYRKIF